MNALRVRSRRVVGLLVLCTFIALGIVGVNLLPSSQRAAIPAAAPAASPAITAARLAVIKDVNYMPVNASWGNMWSKWNPTQISSDMSHISALGANTVRVAISMPVFNYPIPFPTMTARLTTVINLASANHLRVQLTLFDQWGLYNEIPQSAEFINDLVRPLQNNTKIAFIELQNEINPSTPGALAWARAEIPVLRAAAGSIPLTLSTPGALGLAGLQTLKTALASTPLDFYDYHFYGTAGSAYATLAAAKQIASPYPLFVGEAGFSTGSPTAETALVDATLSSQQASFYTLVDTATSDLHLSFAAPWTMFDLSAAGAPAGTPIGALTSGLYTTSGVAKPAASVESAFLKVGTPGPVVANPGFETAPGGVPTGWVAAHPTDGHLAVSSSEVHTGKVSVAISSTSGAQSAQPAWTGIANLGAVAAGHRVQALVWAKGTAATGLSGISVSWFNVNNVYLTNSTSVALPQGTTNWTQLGVDATAPAGAAYAMINLQSYKNSGTVWFDDVSVNNAGAAAFPALPVVPVTSGVGAVVGNPGFETLSSGVPTGWTQAHPTDGRLSVSSSVVHTGKVSVAIAATSGAQSAQPAWTTTANLGAIATGRRVQALVWARGAAATGQSAISVSWFNVNHAYLGNSTSPSLATGTTNWTQLGVTATAPAGSAYAEINLQSYQDSGTVWFDDVTAG